MCGGGRDSYFLPYETGDTVRCTEAAGNAPRFGRVEEQHIDFGIAVVWEDGTRTWYPYDRWIYDDWSKTGFRFELVDDSMYRPVAVFALQPGRYRHRDAGEMRAGWLYQAPTRRPLSLWTWSRLLCGHSAPG